ncbi:polysaccharide biosynthesis tyrosine autokinase [Rhizobium herbae]|uniref:Succinoglycan biosynthesis transport protein ExoP n=1 Tax=Rhizobium herbae TaxID=508661 RepID=A0ABS4EVI1_9HYPH|nr:polysaccharide biosynthesis tyrosine autokinase [Rhizobium herbae]MBP1861801.1 succinoglycan biosynthesis transport protein ExoP [Rhizobium herbae]
MNQRPLPLNTVPSLRSDESDSFIDLNRLTAIALRRSRVVAVCVIACFLVGSVYLLSATPIYTSQTQILLDDNLSKYAEETPSPQSAQQADTQLSSAVEILKSGELALRVTDAENLGENETVLNPPQSVMSMVKSAIRSAVGIFGSRPEISEAAAREWKRELAAAYIQQGLTVERVARSSVVSLSYKSTDPHLAAVVTRAYANAYLTDQLNANFDATERASVWLQERLTDLRQRAQAASLDAEKFKADNGLTSTRGELMSEQQLSDLNSQLIVAQADSASASARYNQFKSIIDQGAENAVNNATISSNQTDNSVIQDLRTRYLTVSKREQVIVQNFSADHPQAVALRAEKSELAGQIFRELQQITASYRNEFEVAKSREASLRQSIEGVVGSNSQANRSLVDLRELEQRATALKTLYESYLGRYEEAAQQRSFPIAKARIISDAGVPTSPSSPKRTMVLALSIVLGFMLGAVIAGLQEFRERFFRLEEDIRSILGHKSLGYLPLIGKKTDTLWNKTRGRLSKADKAKPIKTDTDGDADIPLTRMTRTAVDAPRSAFAETLRNAKLASDVILQGRPNRVIGVVSALPGEGKSTIAANFAGLLAASGKRTLLIDADLRNPAISKMISPAPKTGLVEAVLGEEEWTAGLRVDPQTRLAILPIAPREHLYHTNELLASPGMETLIANVRKSFDYIIVDLAPLAPVIDAKAFSPFADGFLMVIEWGKTPSRLVRDVLHSDPQFNAKILGVMLNKTDMDELGKYSDFGAAEKYRKSYESYYIEQPLKATR